MNTEQNGSLRLSELKTGSEGIIIKVLGHGSFRKRITEMGFVKGKNVKVIKNAPLQDPVEYEIMGYMVSLRRSEANLVEVVAAGNTSSLPDVPFEGMIDEETLKISAQEKGKIINVALVGNPNSGKTTLFNHASGSHERVGNYSGVTVEAKQASMKKSSYTFRITDLPGTYSITEYSPEELFVRVHIMEKMPDIVVNVIDASNLERNLFLTTQLIDMNIKVIIALNMYDELEQKGATFDYTSLGKMIGIPVIPTIASKGNGIDELLDKIIEVYEDKDPIVRHIHINYGNVIEKAIARIQEPIRENKDITDKYSSRYLSIKLLEGDKTTLHLLESCANADKIKDATGKGIREVETEYKDKSETVITDAKYGFISGALGETYDAGKEKNRKKKLDIDDVLTHKIWGFPVFIFFLWVMFQATFTLGNYPMEWIDAGVTWFSDFVQRILPEGALRDLIVNGIIGGVGSVIIFIPNILILFFFISLMEDTGYMARASFIMDKLMHKVGLHGKSFIPLIMGFGCNVPAIMATRTLKNRKDRMLTMLIIPFMSCSARLPVYILLISAFFPHQQGLVMFSMYIIGILVAILMALILKNTIFAKAEAPFVMELPPYRIPTLRNTSIHMWDKGKQYLKKMGTVILLASVIIWALGYYPRNVQYSQNYDTLATEISNNAQLSAKEKENQTAQILVDRESERQEKSYIGQLGHFIEPAIRPLGFDWKIGVSILTGMAAKEVVVSTMGILYQAGTDTDETSGSLKQKIAEQTFTSGERAGQKVFSPLVAFTLMLFVLIYVPCIATIVAIGRESSWKWALFSIGYTVALAWILSFMTYQVGLIL